MGRRLVSGYEDLNALRFGGCQEFTVLEAGPALITNGYDLVSQDFRPEAVRKVFVQENFHACEGRLAD